MTTRQQPTRPVGKASIHTAVAQLEGTSYTLELHYALGHPALDLHLVLVLHL